MTGWTGCCASADHLPTTRTLNLNPTLTIPSILIMKLKITNRYQIIAVSVCSACPECASADGSVRAVAFHDLSVVPEEGEQENKSGTATPCTCDECQKDGRVDENNQAKKEVITPKENNQSQNNTQTSPNTANNRSDRTVDVLVHDAPNMPRFFQSITSPPFHVTAPAPPPGFVIAPYQPPRFHTGGNVEDLLGDVQSSAMIQTTYIQQNSIFMCNTRNVVQNKCCCQNRDSNTKTEACQEQAPKSYVTEKNIELTYDYPRTRPIPSSPTQKSAEEVQSTTTTEVASTVVFVEKKMPPKPKKFDFFFRSRSAPVGENEEPIYATVNKLPKKLRRMELANLEKEVAYKNGEVDSSRTEMSLKTDTESQLPPPDDDTSRSEREKSTIPQRQESPKAKKRKRFSLTFKKRERKRREKKDVKNGVKNGVPVLVESDNERLIEEEQKHKHCTRHRPVPRNTAPSSSYSPRYKRDSYQEITTSHSEHERTNSVCSSVNSLGSACTHKSRKLSVAPQDGSIPWCGCWGAGCV